VSDETSKKHFSYLTQVTTQTKLKKFLELGRKRESFRSLNAQAMRGGGTPGLPFYKGGKGWPSGAKISNFDAPPILKSHGEDQKEMWKEEKVEK
jgi:hypothetical protein